MSKDARYRAKILLFEDRMKTYYTYNNDQLLTELSRLLCDGLKGYDYHTADDLVKALEHRHDFYGESHSKFLEAKEDLVNSLVKESLLGYEEDAT